MKHSFDVEIESNYRALYGKLFSGLIRHFGTRNVYEIEDAIQNAFLKSLKSWKLNQAPAEKENWLFVVARNDVLDQIRSKQSILDHSTLTDAVAVETSPRKDLRLEVILLITSASGISRQAKVLFILKHVFGLKVEEISSTTLIHPETIYKAIKRTKNKLKSLFGDQKTLEVFAKPTERDLSMIEDVLYAIFIIGFDSFDPKVKSIVNEDLCLEALALAQLLHSTYKKTSTKNLLALFCFHSARIPARVANGKLVSFFNQDRKSWNSNMINAGFHYLTKPKELNRFYIESLIASKYMTLEVLNESDWQEINQLYEVLLRLYPSPIVKLNRCYVLGQAGRTEEALAMLQEIEHELPGMHIYFSLVKAELIKASNPETSQQLLDSTIMQLEQSIRKAFLLENKPSTS